MKIFFLFLVFALRLAFSREELLYAPEALVGGCVNAITGEHITSEFTLRVQGAEPIYLKHQLLLPNNHAQHPTTETTPNDNHNHYTYDERGRLSSITNTNQSGNKTYAWARFQYQADTLQKITTSDGREIVKKELYKKNDFTVDHYRLRWNSVGSETITITDESDPRIGRVKTLHDPSETTPTYRFIYHPHSTDVFDAQDNKTTYNYNQDLRLTSIESQNNKELFAWDDEGNLVCKTLLNKEGSPLFSHRFFYDERRNIIKEEYIDNSSQENQTAWTLDENNLPPENIERSTTHYTYSKGTQNLLLRIEKENDLATHFTYLEGTKLISSLFISEKKEIKKRHFYEYNDDNILIKEIIDDGATLTKNNLKGASQRTLTRITPKKSEPFVNMPVEIEESYLDLSTNQEILLKKIQLTYDTHGHVKHKTVIDADATPRYTLNYTYNDQGKLISESNALGQTARYHYDAHGNRDEETSFCSSLTTKLTFDHKQRLTETKQIAIDGTIHITNYLENTTTHTTPQESIDTDTSYFHYTRDYQNRPLTIAHYTQEGELISLETFTYNAFHLLTKTDATGTTTYEYDGAGRKCAQERNGKREEFTYDPLGRLASTQTGPLSYQKKYDLLDRITEESIQDNSGRLLKQTTYAYDNAGNTSRITQWIGDTQESSYFTYDPFGRVTEEIDNEGNITRTEYIESENTLQTIQTTPLGLQTIKTVDAGGILLRTKKIDTTDHPLFDETYFYDDAGNLIRHTGVQEIFYEYDTQNRPTALIEAAHTPNPKITRFTYTGRGQLKELLKPNGTRLAYTYTPQGHLSTLISSDGTIHYSYTYDPQGRLTTSRDENTDQELLRHYDTSGNLIQETLPNGLTLKNTYDDLGRRTNLTLPDSSTIHYTYDTLHLKQITRQNSTGHLLYTHTFTHYDLSGNLLSEEHIDGLGTTTYTLDRLGHTTNLSSFLFSQSTTYDPAGNLTISRLKTPFTDTTSTYTYDPLGQLTQELSPTSSTYTYDAKHNRLTTNNTPQTYTPLNELLKPNATYDPNGNPTKLDNLTLTYDALDRLTEVTSDTHKTTYTYDSQHRRTSKQTHHLQSGSWHRTTTQHYLYDGLNEIGSTNSALEITELRILKPTPHAEIGAAVALELQNTPYCPLHDIFGNLIGLVHLETKQLTTLTQYTAFGEEKPLLTSIHQSPWRYSSKRHDPETNLVYFGRRYYHPPTGRWLTPDPKGFTDTTNLYTFNLNSPLTHRDPYGLETEKTTSSLSNTLGEFIYFLYSNFAIIPPIREAGMAFGNGLKDTPTTIKHNQTILDSVGTGSLHPNLKTYFTNGILNDHINAKQSALAISEALGGTTVYFAYNPSRGVALDCLESLVSLMGFQTRASLLLTESIQADIRANPDITILVVDHSQGNINSNNALSNLSLQHQSHVERHAFGSPSYTEISGLKSDDHYLSTNDPIPLFNPIKYAKACFYPTPNIHFLQSTDDNPFYCHELLGPVYGPELKRIGATYQDRYCSTRATAEETQINSSK